MPTTLPKTKVLIQRASQNLSNPTEGISNQKFEIVYEGFIFLEDISSNSDFDKFFPTGLQEGKRFYIVWDKADIQNDDIISFNLSQIGNKKGSIDSTAYDYYKIQLKVPVKQSGLSILGSRHKEGFCISYD